MGTSEPSCDLQVFKLGMPLSDQLVKLPTVCLLAVDSLTPSLNLDVLVDRLVLAGCSYFMTWGAAADALHDAMDEVLEGRGGGFLSVVTASHRGEPAEDVAWFLVNAALPSETKLRCCVGYADETVGVDALLKAVRAAVPNLR